MVANFKDFGHEIFSAGDIDNYLMSQAVIICTSGTRPSNPPTGMHIWETDTLTELYYNGSGWSVKRYLDRFAYKSNNEIVNNSASLQDDNDLFVPLVANATYLVFAYLIYNTSSTADFRVNFAATSAAINLATMSPHTAQNSLDSNTMSVTNVSSGDIGGAGSDQVAIIRASVKTTPAATLQFRWCQSSAQGTDTTVKVNSFLFARRIA